MAKYRGAFRDCRWCNGNGCMQCDIERRKAEQEAMKPIFTADTTDPEDMEALKRVFHADNLQKEFGPSGGGIRAIEQQAAIESVLQCLRKSRKVTNNE